MECLRVRLSNRKDSLFNQYCNYKMVAVSYALMCNQYSDDIVTWNYFDLLGEHMSVSHLIAYLFSLSKLVLFDSQLDSSFMRNF